MFLLSSNTKSIIHIIYKCIIFQIDKDNDGYILRSELKYYLLRAPISDVPLSERLVDAMLNNVDYNSDGFISLQEFHGLVSY